MAKVKIICATCCSAAFKESGSVNRSRSKGAPLYCSRECAGIARRVDRTQSEKKAEKSAYDKARRAALGDEIKAAKRAAYQAAVAADLAAVRAKEKANRQRRAPQHADYCRRPEYRKWKQQYDRQYRARKEFGDFGEASIVLNDLIAEINARVSRTEIYRQNGTLNKRIARRRDYERQTDRR